MFGAIDQTNVFGMVTCLARNIYIYFYIKYFTTTYRYISYNTWMRLMIHVKLTNLEKIL